MQPKVFISHASEDKKRFVLDFAIKLRERGIDAWLDQWEINPGDSLVDKIFEEGIKNAQAVIVVISKYSVNKPWVREELNASIVKKINKVSKLIPIIIDDCQVPEALHTIVWVKIKDLNNYDEDLDRIVMAIYGQYDRPALGSTPSYAQNKFESLPGLTSVDNLVLKLICEKSLEVNSMWIDNSGITGILEKLKSDGIPQNDFDDALRIFNRKGYIKIFEQMGGDISIFQILVDGFEKYAKNYLKGYDSIVKDVIFKIINNHTTDNFSMSSQTNQKQVIIDHIFRLLAKRKLIRIVEAVGGSIEIYNVSPELRRF